MCVKDLNSPSFYPSMISLWVTDSFERKDMERDLLAKLIIDLTISRDVAMSQDQLIKGYGVVLSYKMQAQTFKALEFSVQLYVCVYFQV